MKQLSVPSSLVFLVIEALNSYVKLSGITKDFGHIAQNLPWAHPKIMFSGRSKSDTLKLHSVYVRGTLLWSFLSIWALYIFFYLRFESVMEGSSSAHKMGFKTLHGCF